MSENGDFSTVGTDGHAKLVWYRYLNDNPSFFVLDKEDRTGCPRSHSSRMFGDGSQECLPHRRTAARMVRPTKGRLVRILSLQHHRKENAFMVGRLSKGSMSEMGMFHQLTHKFLCAQLCDAGSVDAHVASVRLGNHGNARANYRLSFSNRNTNWWGLCSTVGLFVWVVFWLKREPGTAVESILSWGTLAAIHASAIKAARRRYGWFISRPDWSLLDSGDYRAVRWHYLLRNADVTLTGDFASLRRLFAFFTILTRILIAIEIIPQPFGTLSSKCKNRRFLRSKRYLRCVNLVVGFLIESIGYRAGRNV